MTVHANKILTLVQEDETIKANYSKKKVDQVEHYVDTFLNNSHWVLTNKRKVGQHELLIQIPFDHFVVLDEKERNDLRQRYSNEGWERIRFMPDMCQQKIDYITLCCHPPISTAESEQEVS